MPDQTHYEILGVDEAAGRDEVRRAYRRLVLKFHPDRSRDISTTDQFVRIALAYQTLSDDKRRSDYDAVLRYRRDREADARRRRQPQPRDPPARRQTARDPGDLAAKTTEAAALLSQGRFDQAENVARLVLRNDPTRAMAHAILGDIARSRQNLRDALRHYAFAVQFEPRNSTFQRRYEQILAQTGEVSAKGEMRARERSRAPLWVAALLSVFMLSYIAVGREPPLFENFGPLSSWTAGLLVMMFVNGVIAGASLSMTETLDRWESVARGSTGRLSPAVALGAVALVNFWASAALYLFIGFVQNSFTYSTSRLLTAVAALTLSYALMSSLSPTIIWQQTLLWGGNVLYVGVLCGWAVADAFR